MCSIQVTNYFVVVCYFRIIFFLVSFYLLILPFDGFLISAYVREKKKRKIVVSFSFALKLCHSFCSERDSIFASMHISVLFNSNIHFEFISFLVHILYRTFALYYFQNWRLLNSNLSCCHGLKKKTNYK